MNRETAYRPEDAERYAIEIQYLRKVVKQYEMKILSQKAEIDALRELQAKTRKIIQVSPPEFRGPS